MAELDPRKQRILHAIVVEYVSTAEPVGSEALVNRYELGVKGATVRNEMSEMLELGYLVQPHTSAGRIPSDLGYRYYIDRLIITNEVQAAVREKLNKATREPGSLRDVLQDVTRTLTNLSQLMSVATTVRERDVTVRTAILSATGPRQALFVLALSNGQVENRIIELPVGLTLDDLGLVNDQLNQLLVGANLRSLSRPRKVAPSILHPNVERALGVIWPHIRSVARNVTKGTIVRDGEANLLRQPEFAANVHALTALLENLDDSNLLYESVMPGEQTQTVTIGKENRHESFHQLSVIRQSYFVGEEEAGVIALVGPTRMPYPDGIPLVNLTADVLSESLTRVYAQ